MKEHHIQRSLYHWYFSSWEYAATNVYIYWKSEADVAAIQKRSGYLVEYEIKTDWNDFKNDLQKYDKHQKLKLGIYPANRFYYVVSDNIVDKVLNILPNYAGLMKAYEHGSDFKWLWIERLKQAPILHKQKPSAWLLSKIHKSNYHHHFNKITGARE